MQQQDFELNGLTDPPEASTAAQHRRWLEENVKARSSITLTFGDGPLAQVSALVDDDSKTAKDLWTGLDKIYRMSNTQMVINIDRELEKMTFDKDEECDKHVEKFYHLVSKLESYDKLVSSQVKVSRFLQTLPPRFAPIAMVAEASSVPFEKIIASVKAEISRKKSQGNSKSTLPITATVSKSNPKQGGRDTSRINKQNRYLCYFCGKPGH